MAFGIVASRSKKKYEAKEFVTLLKQAKVWPHVLRLIDNPSAKGFGMTVGQQPSQTEGGALSDKTRDGHPIRLFCD